MKSDLFINKSKSELMEFKLFFTGFNLFGAK